jgi:hypothetical protein
MWAFGITWHPSFVVCHLLTFHILIFSSETHQPKRVISLLTGYYNGELFLEMNQSETRIFCGGHVC